MSLGVTFTFRSTHKSTNILVISTQFEALRISPYLLSMFSRMVPEELMYTFIAGYNLPIVCWFIDISLIGGKFHTH